MRLTDPAGSVLVDLRADVRARIAEAATVDEQAIAAGLIVDWSAEQMRQALMLTLPRFVGDVIRLDRASVMNRPTAETPARPSEPAPRPRSPRWESAAAVHSAGLLDTPIRTESGFLRLGECRLPDIEFAHDRCSETAQRNAMQAARYHRLAQRMRDSGASTVADLGESQALEIFHG